MIYIYDLAGQNTYTGPEWTDLTGQDMDESLGRNFLERIHPRDRALVEDTRGKAIETACGYTLRFRLMKPDDSFRWVVSETKPLFGLPDQNLLGLKGSLIVLADDPINEIKTFGNIDQPITQHDLQFAASGDHLDCIAHHIMSATYLIKEHRVLSALPGAQNALFHVAKAIAKRQTASKKLH